MTIISHYYFWFEYGRLRRTIMTSLFVLVEQKYPFMQA